MVSRRPRSVQWWLGVLVLGVAAPVLLLVVVLGIVQVRREQREARAMASRIATATALRVRELHLGSATLLERIATRMSVTPLDSGSCASELGMLELLSHDAGVLLLDHDGWMTCAGSDRAASARPWIEGELRAGRLKPGVPVVRSFGKQTYLAMASRIAGRPETVVLIQSADVLGRAAFVSGGVVLIRDSDGRAIAQWAPSDVAGVTEHAAAVRVPELDWTIYGDVPESALTEPAREMLVNVAAGAAGAIVAFLVMTYALARRIGRPIQALADAATAAGDGAYARVEIAKGPREVIALTDAFNHMVERRRLSDRHMKGLSERLLTVQEEERARIARELHDDLGQSLTALKMDVVGLLQATEQPPALAPIRERILRTLDSTVTSVQRISSELRPSVLDDLGLVAAIDAEARVFEERTGIECEVSVLGTMPVDRDTVTAIYRIVQEALTNVARHSNAARTEVRLRSEGDELLVDVRDDGRGVTAEELHDPFSLGLIGIRERAAVFGGSVHIEGVSGRGTVVSVRVPLAMNARLA